MFEFVIDVLTGKKSIVITDNTVPPASETPSQMMDRAFAVHRERTDRIFSKPLFKN